MSKQWYYEVMGSPVGPISSADLKRGVQTRRILPETRIRLGTDGKWQTADRVKGLFDSNPPATTPEPRPPATSKPPRAADTGTAEMATLQTEELKISVAAVTPAIALDRPASPAAEEDDTEYDFFKFVGFEIAIGHALNDVLKEYCRVHHVTMTQTTRRALAEFLGRKDLAGNLEPPPAAAPAGALGVS